MVRYENLKISHSRKYLTLFCANQVLTANDCTRSSNGYVLKKLDDASNFILYVFEKRNQVDLFVQKSFATQ